MPAAAASRSLTSLTRSAPDVRRRICPSSRSSSRHDRLVSSERPAITAPATPKQAPLQCRRGRFEQKPPDDGFQRREIRGSKIRRRASTPAPARPGRTAPGRSWCRQCHPQVSCTLPFSPLPNAMLARFKPRLLYSILPFTAVTRRDIHVHSHTKSAGSTGRWFVACCADQSYTAPEFSVTGDLTGGQPS